MLLDSGKKKSIFLVIILSVLIMYVSFFKEKLLMKWDSSRMHAICSSLSRISGVASFWTVTANSLFSDSSEKKRVLPSQALFLLDTYITCIATFDEPTHLCLLPFKWCWLGRLHNVFGATPSEFHH